MICSKIIKNQRLKLKQTQTEAAESVNASLRTFQAWERGERNIPMAKWRLYLMINGVKDEI